MIGCGGMVRLEAKVPDGRAIRQAVRRAIGLAGTHRAAELIESQGRAGQMWRIRRPVTRVRAMRTKRSLTPPAQGSTPAVSIDARSISEST
jgi:hypothetical protein